MSRRAVLGLLAGGVLASACSDDSGSPSGEAASSRPRPQQVRYGEGRSQVADLWLPVPRPREPVGVLVLIHGGFWRPRYDRSLMEPLARDAANRGWAAWNIEYRASGTGGGGWPATFEDVAAAMDALAEQAERAPLDLDRVATVGHSAGGCLALWAAARGGLPDDAPGAKPAVEPALAVSLAGVNNLIAGWFEDLGSGAIEALMGVRPGGTGDPYTYASPAERLPIGVQQVLVHGTADDIVPLDQSTAYGAKAEEAGDTVEVVVVPGATHFDVIEPGGGPWSETRRRLRGVLG